MNGKQAGMNMKKLVAAAIMTSGCLVALVVPAFADYTDTQGETSTLRNPLIPGASFTNQLMPAPIGQAPPIGSGATPKPVVPGDQGQPPVPPTGAVDPTDSIFTTRNGPGPQPPSEYVPNAGRHQTIKGQEQGVLDMGQEELGTKTTNNGGPLTNAADTENNGGPRANAQDTMDRLFTHTIQPNRYDYEGPLPTVRVFCRYLVILGVVVATIWMAQAGMGMAMGNSYAGSRAIGTAAGLLLLIAGYTIWKIVEMNTFNANSTGWESNYRDGTPQPLQQKNTSNTAGPTNGTVLGGNTTTPFGGAAPP
jgi:hypothetical protein